MPRPPLPYKEALAWLYGLQRFGIKLGLENIRRLIAELHIDLRGSRVIHVAGTNGKGSVCAMIDSILREHGRRTGLFTSPHLVTFRERISVNGEMISQDAVANGLTAIRGLVADWNPHPTFFEIITALALKYFSEEKIDIVVLETGMGGRLDATNAVQSDVSVITSIDFDHEKWLGRSLREIATEKAGIMKPKVPVICAPQRPEAEEMIRGRAAECEAPIEFVTASYDKTPIALAGSYQKQNAALAIAALRVANIDINDSSIARGLASVDWPARFQHWNDRIVIDGAHNPAAAYVLAQTWRETFGDQRAMLILAIFSDKDLRGICEALAPISDYVFLPKIRSERAAPPDELAKVLSTITPSLPYSITESIGEALAFARSKPNPILITGSLHFAGEVLAHLRGEPAAFEECAQ
ncbi:MAG: bifunctional folylpolyglutamate synthase/dihydrofolate synthase [Verrucomicrobia bacterium]|nr:MAG: bifunctional folylpolyglutamate synthase/dihydrofolate synthase [Verrucomicrobiota bacterium]